MTTLRAASRHRNNLSNSQRRRRSFCGSASVVGFCLGRSLRLAASALVVGVLHAAPAFAEGGRGGGYLTGVPGGLDNTTGTGSSGHNGINDATRASGGGGGGAGLVGGAGGTGWSASGGGAVGGLGGATSGADGGDGADSPISTMGGGGGGGGAHGAAVSTSGNLASAAGGSGGNGGNGAPVGGWVGGGGGGGAGGYGTVITGSGLALTNSGIVAGGKGGRGGDRGAGAGAAGGGGSGGNGLAVTGFGNSLVNTGTIAGGNGGAAGFGAGVASAQSGAGGVGIVGAVSGGISIINSGTISGGLSGDGTTSANAAELYGSDNRFELQAGSNIVGNVVVASGGTNNVFVLGGTGSANFDASHLLAVAVPGSTEGYAGFTAFEKTGLSTWTLSGSGNQNWTIRDGTLSGNTASMAGNLTFATGPGTRAVVFNQGVDGTYSGTISGDGSFRKLGVGTVTLTGNSNVGSFNLQGGGLRVDGGSLEQLNTGAQSFIGQSAGDDATLVIANRGTVSTVDKVHVGDSTGSRGRVIVTGTGSSLNVGDLTVGFAGDGALSVVNGGLLSANDFMNVGGGNYGQLGTGLFLIDGTGSGARIGGALTIAGYGDGSSGSVTVSNGGVLDVSGDVRMGLGNSSGVAKLNIGAASTDAADAVAPGTLLAPEIQFYAASASLNFNHTGSAYTFGADLVSSGAGSGVINHYAGSTTLTGDNSNFSGNTWVYGGSLSVDGILGGAVNVATGGTLGGSGVVPTTVISGGTLSPGNSPGTLTVKGNLTLTPGSTYLAEIQGVVSDRVNVTGTASLAGTLRLVPLGGAYSFNSAYTLLSAAGGLGGTSFSPVDTTGSFGDGVTTAVSYTANDVQLTLTPKPLTPIVDPVVPTPEPASPRLGAGRPANAYAVASAIDAAVANGADPSALFAIYNLPAASIPAAVNSLSGEVHAAAPAMAHVASDQFLRTMLDPTAAGRLGAGAAGPGAAAFSGLVRKGADQPVGPSRFDVPFYSVWGSAYGSYGRTDGNTAIGSARRTIDDAHLATGIDIRLLPGTVAGVAVSGGKARASLPGLTGRIDADVFQAGLYGVTQLGPVKLGGALSYARLENDVSRGIPVLGSTLASSYATTAWSGRLQASAALLSWNGLSFSPLAAIQATRARSPAVTEANWAGGNAGALALGRRSDVTARSELGLQLDADTVLGGIAVTGHVRAAWAHYFERDADLTASLIGLPGATFTATGAEADRDSALVSAGVMAKLSENVSLGLNLDGELSANSNRLGGSAQLRVSF